MSDKKCIIFTIVMLLLIWLCPCTAMAKEAPREKKAFTILVYMIGSNKWSLPELADSASGHGRLEISGNG